MTASLKEKLLHPVKPLRAKINNPWIITDRNTNPMVLISLSKPEYTISSSVQEAIDNDIHLEDSVIQENLARVKEFSTEYQDFMITQIIPLLLGTLDGTSFITDKVNAMGGNLNLEKYAVIARTASYLKTIEFCLSYYNLPESYKDLLIDIIRGRNEKIYSG